MTFLSGGVVQVTKLRILRHGANIDTWMAHATCSCTSDIHFSLCCNLPESCDLVTWGVSCEPSANVRSWRRPQDLPKVA